MFFFHVVGFIHTNVHTENNSHVPGSCYVVHAAYTPRRLEQRNGFSRVNGAVART